MDIKYQLVYKADRAFGLFTGLAFPMIMLLVWGSVYYASGTMMIGNFTFLNMLVYFFVLSATGTLAYSSASWIIQDDVKTGGIVVFLIRPISYLVSVYTSDFSGAIIDMVLTSVPIFLIVTFLAHLSISLGVVAVVFLMAMIGYVIISFVATIVGLLSVYWTDVSGIISTMSWFNGVLGGSLIPISLFPSQISSVLSLLPFQFAFYLPAAVFSGAISVEAALGTIGIGIFWMLVLGAFVAIFWSRARNKINSVGV